MNEQFKIELHKCVLSEIEVRVFQSIWFHSEIISSEIL